MPGDSHASDVAQQANATIWKRHRDFTLGILPSWADFQDADRLFTFKVLPVLSEKCFGCHGDPTQKLKGGLDMTSLEALLKGGDEHPDTIVPDDAAKNFIMTTVRWEDED